VLHLDGRDVRCPAICSNPSNCCSPSCRLVPAPVLYADHIHGEGVEVFRAACNADLKRITLRPRCT
jgi:hypothetical protein